jgi:hypothetical protein
MTRDRLCSELKSSESLGSTASKREAGTLIARMMSLRQNHSVLALASVSDDIHSS